MESVAGDSDGGQNDEAAPKAEEALEPVSASDIEAKFSQELRFVLGMSVVYLVALDGQYTSVEQTWVDENFEEGAGEKIVEILSDIDWQEHHQAIRSNILKLNDADKGYIRNEAKPFFLDLLTKNDLTKMEYQRLQEFMDFLDECMDGTDSGKALG